MLGKNETWEPSDIVTRLRYIYSQRDVGVSVNPDTFTEAADEIERLRADRDRYRALAEYLCQNAPSMIVPDEIACLFPDPLLVRSGSTN